MAQRRPTSGRVSERERDHRARRWLGEPPPFCHRSAAPTPTPFSTPRHPSFAATTFTAFSSFLHRHCRRRCRRIRLLHTLSYSFTDAFWPPRSVCYYCVRSFVRTFVYPRPRELVQSARQRLRDPCRARLCTENIRFAPSSSANVVPLSRKSRPKLSQRANRPPRASDLPSPFLIRRPFPVW